MTGIKQKSAPIKDSTKQREAYFLDFAEKARKVITSPLVVTGGFRTPEGMAEAIASGAVDFVGIARGMAVEPDLPNRLLMGKNPLYPVTPKKTGIGFIDKMGMMEVSWYTAQLKRMGQGLDTLPNESVFLSFLKVMMHQIKSGLNAPKRLRAS
jgi:hypothetical protein